MDKNMKDLIDMVRFIKDTVETLDEKVERLDEKVERIDEKLEKVSGNVVRIDSKLGAFENHEVDKRKQLEVRVSKLERV